MSDEDGWVIKVAILGKMANDPAELIAAIVEVTKILCGEVGLPHDNGIVLLLAAAANLGMTTTGLPSDRVEDGLSSVLSKAVLLGAMASEDGCPDEPSNVVYPFRH